jgi:hypothetical protein
MDLVPGVLAFRQRISFILGRIFLLIGTDEDQAGQLAARFDMDMSYARMVLTVRCKI